ncbi:MAG: putative porin [Ignavibacteria bacterium]
MKKLILNSLVIISSLLISVNLSYSSNLSANKSGQTDFKSFTELLNFIEVLNEDTSNKTLKEIPLRDTIIPINSTSLISSNSQTIDKFLIERKNFFSPVHLINWQTNSFLLDLGLPSNFYNLYLFQSDNRSTSFLINDIEINDPLTNLIDLRDLRFDEFESIEIIFPTRSFLFSRFNSPTSIRFNEWKRYSPIPYSRVKYIEAPYDNLFFDGMFNVNLTKKINFEFGITKHNALGRFLNSEKDLWAGKLKSTFYLSNKMNFNLSYRYSKSLVRFNEGINLNNPLLAPNEPVENILYDNQRALVINDDAYHKWTINRVNFQTLIKPNDFSITELNLYFNQSLREFRDNERKADSLKTFQNHWSKVFGSELKENLNFLFNQIELQLKFERIIIESPFFFKKLIDDQLSGYTFYRLNLLEKIKPSFYVKLVSLDESNKHLFSYGADLDFKVSEKINLIFGYSNFTSILSYDERYFNSFNLTDFEFRNKLFSTKLNYSSENLKLNLESFFRDIKTFSTPISYYSIEQNSNILNYYFSSEKLYGGKFDLDYSFWKLNSSISFIYNDRIQNFNNSSFHRINQPRFQTRFEIYYRDLLFKSSLDLIAGFRVNAFSSFSARSFSSSKLVFVDSRNYNDTLFNFASIKIPANFTIDLFASGRIKETAIVYLSIENLLDRKFYLTPYYPANDIQFRFGLIWEFYD